MESTPHTSERSWKTPAATLLALLMVGVGGYQLGQNKPKDSTLPGQMESSEPDLSPLRSQLEQTAGTLLSSDPLSTAVELQVSAEALESTTERVLQLAARFEAAITPVPADAGKKQFLITTTPARLAPLVNALRKGQEPEQVTIPGEAKGEVGTEFVDVIIVSGS